MKSCSAAEREQQLTARLSQLKAWSEELDREHTRQVVGGAAALAAAGAGAGAVVGRKPRRAVVLRDHSLRSTVPALAYVINPETPEQLSTSYDLRSGRRIKRG